MQRDEFLLLSAPLGSKFMPIVMLVIASHENGLRHGHARDSLAAFVWRQHSASSGFEIDDVAYTRQDVRLVPLHCLAQFVQQTTYAVDVRDGQNFNFSLGHGQMFGDNMPVFGPERNAVGSTIMNYDAPKAVRIQITEEEQVSGVFKCPANARSCYVLAHGAGAGMNHPFMVAVADGLAERRIATLRFQFPYMEKGSKRPDQPKIAHAAVRAAVAEAARLAPELPLFAGGKSFGGRMTSQAQALEPLPGVRGLIFLGFPLHPAGKPSDERAKHLFEVKVPMLFLQGTRDELADRVFLEAVCERLGKLATLKLFEEADHSFHVPARTGRKDSEVRSEMLDTIAAWLR